MYIIYIIHKQLLVTYNGSYQINPNIFASLAL